MKRVLWLSMAVVAALSLSGCFLIERADIHVSLKSPTVIGVTMSGVVVSMTMLESEAAGKPMKSAVARAEISDLLSMMTGKDAIRRLDHIDGAKFAVETSGDMTSRSKKFSIFEFARSEYGPRGSGTFWVVSLPKFDSRSVGMYEKIGTLSGRLCATPLPEMALVPNLPIRPEKVRLDGVDAWCLHIDQNSLSTGRYLAFYYPGKVSESSLD